MWWRLGLLAAVTAAILLFLITPMQSVTIKVDLPPGPPGRRSVSAEQVRKVATEAIWALDAAMVGGVLMVAGLIGWRIVRRGKPSR